jgi:hypothetical protein
MLVIIWLVGALTPDRDRPTRREWSVLDLAIFLGAGINATFNFLRYNVPFNASELESWRRVPTVAQWASNFAGLCVSPNGGLLFFWLPACAVIATAARSASRQGFLRAWPALAVLVMLLVLLVGFADYWSPFGWVGWGPRYIVPWIPSLSLILLCKYPQAAEQLARRALSRPKALITTACVLCALSIPHILVIGDHGEVQMSNFYAPTAEYPVGGPDKLGLHYRQLNYLIWRAGPMPLHMLRRLAEPLAVCQAGLYAAGLLSVLILTRRSLAPASPD